MHITSADEWRHTAALSSLQVAMEESLEEAQARKAAEKPLNEKSAEELAQVGAWGGLLATAHSTTCCAKHM